MSDPIPSGEAPSSLKGRTVGPAQPDHDCATPPRSNLGRSLGYFYLLRFSLLLWLSLPAFVGLDLFNVLTTATRGILTIESGQGWIWAGFFVTITGWIALLFARVTCAYGEDRFNLEPPDWMKVGTDMSWRTFLLAQLPGLSMLLYLWYLATHDGGRTGGVSPCALVAGALVAVALWALLTVFSYWTYETDDNLRERGIEISRQKRSDPNGLTSAAFFAPIVNAKFLRELEKAPPPALARGFNDLFQRLGRGAGPGFHKDPCNPNSPLNAGLSLTLILFVYLAFLYYIFFFYTAPVALAGMRYWLLIPVLGGLLIWFYKALPYFKTVFDSSHARIAKYFLGVVVVLLPVWLLVGYAIALAIKQKPNIDFPVIASVYILLFSLCSGLSGLAFLLDRYRVPVLTSAIVAFVPLHLVAGIACLQGTPFGEAQHIVQTRDRAPVSLMYPQGILDRFHDTHAPGTPIIIVTATGGGMHAASWTAQLLGDLEKKFSEQSTPIPFHDSILLMSTVSGGSVGASEWIQAYRRPGTQASFEDFTARAREITECSSLEAIAWGLIYPDIIHLFVPFRFTDRVEGLDRSWSLQTAIERNERTRCSSTTTDESLVSQMYLGTLADFAQALNSGSDWVPAFSLNTTVAETGDRFLLANYRLPMVTTANSELLLASSFLDVFWDKEDPSHPQLADLPLSGAARLSASFPFVSSMSRVPRNVAKTPYHFGDGGYFDNDGTGTVIEFLRQAYLAHCDDGQSHTSPDTKPKEVAPCPQATIEHPAPRDRILLIEIRDGDEPRSDNPPDSESNQESVHAVWGPASQLGGPIETFYHAGHESVTRRNRGALCLLETALRSNSPSVSIEHFVFAYHQDRPNFTQPLNWHLTKADKDEIQLNLDGKVQYKDKNGKWVKSPTPTPRLEEVVAKRFRDLLANPRSASVDCCGAIQDNEEPLGEN